MGLIFFVKNFAKILRSFWGNTDDEILFVIIYISYLHTSFKEMKPHSNLVKYPIIYKVLYISFGAGSIKDLPSFGFSSLIIAIVSWGYRAIWSCYSSDSRAGEDPTRYAGEGALAILANGSQLQTRAYHDLDIKIQPPKLANHIFQWGFQPPCHFVIPYIFADSGYSLQLSRRSFLQQKDFWGEGDSGASDFPSFFQRT